MNLLKRQRNILNNHRFQLYNCTRSIATLPKPVINVTHSDNEVPSSTLEAIQRVQKYTLGVYKRPTVMLDHGKGCYVYDSNDRSYLDFTAGIAVNALGHADPTVIKDLHHQSQKLIHTSNIFYNANSGLLAEKLVETTNKYANKDWAHKVFLCNSGTEANEGALKFARKWGKSVGGDKKTHLVCFKNGFHGRSLGSLSVTPNRKIQKPYTPLLPSVDVLEFNNASEALHEINEHTAGVIVEPIQGEGGVNIADQEFLRALRKRCNQTQTLLIYDEIQCGLGRTGKMWAHQLYDDFCTPDVLTMAKSLANGVPIGAIMTTKKVADVLDAGDHGSTSGGNPLSSAVALGVIDRITNESFLNNVIETGYALYRDLQALRDEYPDTIKMVRGHGLLLGVEFHKNPEPLIKLARERGLLITAAANNTIRIIPPLILTKEEARTGIARFFGAIKEFI